MIYILIVLWFGDSTYTAGKAALAVEFNSKQACQAAAAEIRRQSSDYGRRVGTLVCAAKGGKP